MRTHLVALLAALSSNAALAGEPPPASPAVRAEQPKAKAKGKKAKAGKAAAPAAGAKKGGDKQGEEKKGEEKKPCVPVKPCSIDD